jgi:hypothetical protein
MAKKIREEYEYMDNMPLEGWAWEFIRRSVRFRSAFQTITTVYSRYPSSQFPEPWPEDFKKAHDYIDSMIEVRWGALMSVHDPHWFPCSVGRFGKTACRFVHLYPDPNVRYCDFANYCNRKDGKRYHFADRIPIRAAYPFKIVEHSTLEWNISSNLDRFKAGIKEEKRSSATDELDKMAELVRLFCLEPLKISESGNTVCIAISKKARMEDIKTELLGALAAFLNKRKPRIRDQKWKLYLIVYDLKSKHEGASYEELADKLQEICPHDDPSKVWDGRTVENHYKQALHLINGEYKKYLYI